jgi:hypothetical protein
VHIRADFVTHLSADGVADYVADGAADSKSYILAFTQPHRISHGRSDAGTDDQPYGEPDVVTVCFAYNVAID